MTCKSNTFDGKWISCTFALITMRVNCEVWRGCLWARARWVLSHGFFWLAAAVFCQLDASCAYVSVCVCVCALIRLQTNTSRSSLPPPGTCCLSLGTPPDSARTQTRTILTLTLDAPVSPIAVPAPTGAQSCSRADKHRQTPSLINSDLMPSKYGTSCGGEEREEEQKAGGLRCCRKLKKARQWRNDTSCQHNSWHVITTQQLYNEYSLGVRNHSLLWKQTFL